MNQKTQTTEKLLPDYPPGFIANTIEIHDERGMLVRIENQKIVAQGSRPKGFKPEFVCWKIDGQSTDNIAYVHTHKSILVDRISQIDTSKLTQL